MLLLLKTLPSRYRFYSPLVLTERTGPLFWRNSYSGWTAISPETSGLKNTKYIWDEKSPRFAFKPCYAEKEVHTQNVAKIGPDPVKGSVTNVGHMCGHPSGDRFTGRLSVNSHSTGWGYLAADDIVARRDVQDGINALLNEYYRHMYTIGNDLPDMTVFFKELSDFRRAWQQIISFSKGWANLVREYGFGGRDKWITPKSKAGKKMVAIIDASSPRDPKRARSAADAFVGYNFGIAAPLRDCCDILSEILAKLTALVPDGQERKEHFTKVIKISETSPRQTLGGDCYRYQCAHFPTMGLKQTVRDIEVRVSITSVMTRELTGSNIEKAIAAVLGVLGLLPNVETLWEMTKLSWMVDYLFRTDKLFRKLGLLSLSPVKPVVLAEVCSLSIVQTLTTERYGCIYDVAPCSLQSRYDRFERALGTYPIESVLDYATHPDLKEFALAAAVAKQWFF